MKPQLVIRTDSPTHPATPQQPRSPLSQTTFPSSPNAAASRTASGSSATSTSTSRQNDQIFTRSNLVAQQQTSTNTTERARSISLSERTSQAPPASSGGAAGGEGLRPVARAALVDGLRRGSMDHRRPNESSSAGGAARRLAVGLRLGKLAPSSMRAGSGGASTDHLAPYQSSLHPLPPTARKVFSDRLYPPGLPPSPSALFDPDSISPSQYAIHILLHLMHCYPVLCSQILPLTIRSSSPPPSTIFLLSQLQTLPLILTRYRIRLA